MSEKSEKQVMLVIKRENCPQNHSCPAVATCPVEALSQSGKAVPEVDQDKCVQCGACAKACPKKALVLV